MASVPPSDKSHGETSPPDTMPKNPPKDRLPPNSPPPKKDPNAGDTQNTTTTK